MGSNGIDEQEVVGYITGSQSRVCRKEVCEECGECTSKGGVKVLRMKGLSVKKKGGVNGLGGWGFELRAGAKSRK